MVADNEMPKYIVNVIGRVVPDKLYDKLVQKRAKLKAESSTTKAGEASANVIFFNPDNIPRLTF